MSIGAIALVFLAAMQALAVATVMPIVSADLDGEALYAVAFSATLAASVVGMVGAGAWSDRRGPGIPLTAAVGAFVAGLVLAGAAPTMEVFVAGRLMQGLGGGGITVALYVVVARAYPSELHGRVFAAFSAAWVVPSLVGPFAAGAVAQYAHWRWVFVGVAVLAIAAYSLLLGRLGALGADTSAHVRSRLAGDLAAAIAVALGLMLIGVAGRTGAFTVPTIVIALIVVLVALRRLVPAGMLRAGRGLPSVILMRGILAGAFFGAEVYIPLYFVEEHAFTPVWAGVGLTVGAITWAAASDLQGRLWRGWADIRMAKLSGSLLAVSLAVVVVAAGLHLHPAVLMVAWASAAGGMGLIFPRLSVLTLRYSTPADQGANSAALSISDAVGAAAVIAIMGLIFTSLSGTIAFTAVFGCATVVAILTLVPAGRLLRPSPTA